VVRLLIAEGKAFVAADGVSLIWPFPLSLQGRSPTPEPKFIGAFARYHYLGKIGIESGTDFFKPDCVRSQLSLRTNGMEFQTLQNTHQPVHVQIPDVDLTKEIGFVHFRTIFCCRGMLFGFLRSITVSEERSKCWLDTRIAERLSV
jgi:hypothetical protein